jgi:hypothetical protein
MAQSPRTSKESARGVLLALGLTIGTVTVGLLIPRERAADLFSLLLFGIGAAYPPTQKVTHVSALMPVLSILRSTTSTEDGRSSLLRRMDKSVGLHAGFVFSDGRRREVLIELANFAVMAVLSFLGLSVSARVADHRILRAWRVGRRSSSASETRADQSA